MLVTVDHPGMGMSSRHNGYYNVEFTPQESLDFFVEHFERWRKQFALDSGFDMDKIFLLGHSFGGYVSGHYTTKYP